MGAVDPFDLKRFVTAQESDDTYRHAVGELHRGHKRTHWMWFVFPQLAGLGVSPTSRHYAIASLEEARAYLAHPILGPRLHECIAIVLQHPGRTAEEIFGAIDAQKLRSSMTLFLRAAPGGPDCASIIDQFFEGLTDPRTDRLS